MNKQEAIEKAKEHGEFYSTMFGGTVKMAPIGPIIDIISQIHEPQKVVVPKFVAEWIEIHKKSFAEASAIDMYDNLTLDNSNGYYHDVWLWVVYHHYDFIRAWHEGYEVEREKLYTVEIPDPNADGYSIVLGRKEGKVRIKQVWLTTWKMNCSNQLTESEIKQDFDWAWEFRKEVD